jgi:hypothetical protein
LKRLKETNAYLSLFIIIVITAIIYFISFRNGHDWGGDFSQYIAQAKGIAEGTIDKVVYYSNYRYNMSSLWIGPRLYPWGFPLLLSPVYYIFGLNIFAMKVYVSLFFFLSLGVIFLLFKDKLTYIQTLLLVTIFALNPRFFLFKDNVVSDIPFFFFSLFTIFLIQRIVINKRIWINRFVSYSLLGFFIFFSYYIRSQGILLIPTLLIGQYITNRDSLKQDFRSYLRLNKSDFIPYITFLIFVVSSSAVLPRGSSSYLEHFAGMNIRRIISNIYYYIILPSDFFGPLIASKVLYGITIPFVVLGIIKNIKKDYLYLVYMTFTIILFIFWPARQGLRFIFSILPFYIYFLLVGLSNILTSEIIPPKYNLMKWDLVHIFCIPVILGSCAGIVYTLYYSDKYKSNVIEGPYTSESIQMFNYISTNTSKDDVIIFWKPRVMTLYTDRRAIVVAGFDQIISSNATYIVTSYRELLSEDKPLIDLSVIKSHREIFKLVFQNKEFKVYRIMGKK